MEIMKLIAFCSPLLEDEYLFGWRLKLFLNFFLNSLDGKILQWWCEWSRPCWGLALPTGWLRNADPASPSG